MADRKNQTMIEKNRLPTKYGLEFHAEGTTQVYEISKEWVRPFRLAVQREQRRGKRFMTREHPKGLEVYRMMDPVKEED